MEGNRQTEKQKDILITTLCTHLKQNKYEFILNTLKSLKQTLYRNISLWFDAAA